MKSLYLFAVLGGVAFGLLCHSSAQSGGSELAVVDAARKPGAATPALTSLADGSTDRSGAAVGKQASAEALRSAAQRGDAKAQFLLGQAYEKGEGMEHNPRLAFDWYLQAEQKDHAQAQVALGGLYYLGRGVERDYEEAARWWKLAAEQNETKAHINLANLYLIGLGVEPSKIEAYAHFNLAGRDSEEAAMERDVLEKKMNPEQVADAQRRTKDLKKGIESKLESIRAGTNAPSVTAR